MSSADRDARIATIADIERRADYGSGNLTGHVVWLCAELRASLSREEEAKKDAERLDALEDWYVDSTGEPFIVGPDARGNSFVVDPCGASDVRVMIDAERAARSVSLSENG